MVNGCDIGFKSPRCLQPANGESLQGCLPEDRKMMSLLMQQRKANDAWGQWRNTPAPHRIQYLLR